MPSFCLPFKTNGITSPKLMACALSQLGWDNGFVPPPEPEVEEGA